MAKKRASWSKISAQDKVTRGNNWYGGQYNFFKRKIKGAQVGVLMRPSSLSRGLRLHKKLDLWRTLLSKNVAMLNNHAILFVHALISPLKKSWMWCKPWSVKNSFRSQSYCFVPPKIIDRCTFFTISLNWSYYVSNVTHQRTSMQATQ